MIQSNFDSNSKLYGTLNMLREIIKQGITLGLTGLDELLTKLDSVEAMIKCENIKIVLLGSFSDGKTSVIAGLLEKLEDSMKIDMDESSDELTIYRLEGLDNVEIIDTPGLFGTKEREINGKNVKYSEITKKYLSEAQIILYVCDAVTPIKDSHLPVMQWILRDLKKLDATVFVINKMDEAGYDLTDSEEYSRAIQIKTENLVSRLQQTISLTSEELEHLRVVCIAADPKGKGLTHWLENIQEYKRRSHIDALQLCVDSVIGNSDKNILKLNAVLSSCAEIFRNIINSINIVTISTDSSLIKVEESLKDLKTDKSNLQNDLNTNKKLMSKEIDEYKKKLLGEIRGSNTDTIADVISSYIGISGETVDFNVVQRELSNICTSYFENNMSKLECATTKFEQEFTSQDAYIKNSVNVGVKLLKNVKITNAQVKAARDIIASGHKFKPWGAVKLANNVTKGIGAFASGITVVLEFKDWVKKYKDAKSLDNMKKHLIVEIEKMFSDVNKSISDDNFYKNYAPSFLDLCRQLQQREIEIEQLKLKIKDLDNYKQRVSKFSKEKAEDTNYKTI